MPNYAELGPVARIALAVTLAVAYSLLCYFLVESILASAGFITVSFAVLQPAIVSAFVAYVGDPLGQRDRAFYILTPVAITVGMITIAAFLLQEGVVCIAMLSPIWVASGMAGSLLLYKFRPDQREPDNYTATFRASGLLAIPLVLLPIEQGALPVQDRFEVSRSVEISGEQAEIWQLMQSIPSIESDEGQWNFTQSAIGVPRPLRAAMDGTGVGAIRHADWDHNIRFEEHVTDWQEGSAISWKFVFPDKAGWDFTDRHLHPDSGHMTIETGGYRLEKLADQRFRLTLHTTYSARTSLNAYAALWGEKFLGDIQSNVLQVIRQRVES